MKTGHQPRVARLIAWHALVVAAMLGVLPYTLFRTAFWSLSGANPLFVGTFAACYILATVSLMILGRRGAGISLWGVSTVAAAALAMVYLTALLTFEMAYSRAMVLVATTVFVFGLFGPDLVTRLPRRILAAAAAAILAMIGAYKLDLHDRLKAALPGVATPSAATGNGTRRTSVIRTNNYTLSATYFNAMFPTRGTKATGGAIAADPSTGGYLLVRARGDIYRVIRRDSSGITVRPTGIRVPINDAEFEADVGAGIDIAGFRVADLVVQDLGHELRVLASHHFWNRAQRCFVVRVSMATLPRGDAGAHTVASAWQTVFESAPCLALKSGRGAAFAGVQIGGNMVALSRDRILLMVGDHQFDGWYGAPNYVRDPAAHYGKGVVIDLGKKSVSFFATGLRNPQGVVMDADGRIWETEHGPQGGDELNLLQLGRDYGWPMRSLGSEYGSVSWPLNDSMPGVRYTEPALAWVPSIGPSDLMFVTDTAFARWRGDLLVGALTARALVRARLDQDHVILTEVIPIGERVRDIESAGRGEIMLWTDQETIVSLTPLRTVDRGAELYTMSCGGCHDDYEHRIGPNLRGVVGRPIASASGYSYSNALRAARGRWTEENLHRFITRSEAMFPGTTMRLGGITDSTTRAAIVEYLKSFR